MKIQKNYHKFYSWILAYRSTHVKESTFVIFLSLMIGVFCGFAAYLMRFLIHQIQNFVVGLSDYNLNYWYFAFPITGIFLAAIFVRFIVKDDISHGVTKILYAISQRKAIIKAHNMWSSLVASSITIGFGGSVGPEAPIVLTGSAIGSNLGRWFKLDQKTLMLLVGCGASGAIAAIFKAPIAGVAFTLEVLMLDLTMTSIAPLIIASVSGTAISYFLTGTTPLFDSHNFMPFDLGRIPIDIVLGVCCGLMSLYFVRGTYYFEKLIKRVNNFWVKIFIGGSLLGLLIFVLPPLYGEGYGTITELLNGNFESLFQQSLLYDHRSETWAIIVFVAAIAMFKIFASVLTNGGGGTGGLFAPALFVGCTTGFLVAFVLNKIGVDAPPTNFAFAGMAGLMSGVMSAPLTGIFLMAELTGGHDLFMTLIIVSVTSYVTIIIFEPHSIYAKRLADKGELLTHNKDKGVLILLKMENVLETDLEVVYPQSTLGELVNIISKSKRNIFPVVDKRNGKFLGVVTLDEVRNIMFRESLYNRFTVEKLMIVPPVKILYDTPMDKVMEVFEDSNTWNLPVVDKNGTYKGFVSKSKIFNSYRQVLVHYSSD